MSWPITMGKSKYPVLHLIVNLLDHIPAGRWSIQISFGLPEQAMSMDSVSAIGQHPQLITPLARACYGVIVIFQIL